MANATAGELAAQGKHIEANVWRQSREVLLQALQDTPRLSSLPVEQWQRAVVPKAITELQSTLALQQQDGGM